MSMAWISTALTFFGLLILAGGAAIAARSAAVCENDAEKLALGLKPDYDLKWALIRRGATLRSGLAAIVVGSTLQMAGVLIAQ